MHPFDPQSRGFLANRTSGALSGTEPVQTVGKHDQLSVTTTAGRVRGVDVGWVSGYERPKSDRGRGVTPGDLPVQFRREWIAAFPAIYRSTGSPLHSGDAFDTLADDEFWIDAVMIFVSFFASTLAATAFEFIGPDLPDVVYWLGLAGANGIQTDYGMVSVGAGF